MGDVTIGRGSSLWPCAVARGDTSSIIIGEYTSIQDNCVIHCDSRYPASIGSFVTLGHGAIVHGSAIGDCCIIGMNAVVLNGAAIGRGSIVAAGTVVPEKSDIPPFSLAVGSPLSVKEGKYRDLIFPLRSAVIYAILSAQYRKNGKVARGLSDRIDDLAADEARRLQEMIDSGSGALLDWSPPSL